MNTDFTYCKGKDFEFCNSCYRNINLHTDFDKYINTWFLRPYITKNKCLYYKEIKEYL